MWRVAIFVIFLSIPLSSQAAVSISEVAWMGSSESANYEWIELHNDGAAVELAGWHLSDGMNFDIELAGVIPASSYIVLERTSDASAPGSAFLIYTGALVNTGATLSLTTADGSLVDRVSGGEGWQSIGGDNVTKETPQYTASGWVTATPTPGRGITVTEVSKAEREEAFKETPKGLSAEPTKVEAVKLTLPDVTLQLKINAPKTTYVHQTVSFAVEASGIGENLINSLIYEWNFGDGEISAHKETVHSFQYPGTYVVVVYAGFKRQEQVARHTITVLPVTLSLTTSREGDIQVNNDSPYEVDLSGYRLVGGNEAFTFAPRTILLPSQTITISSAALGKTVGAMVAIYDAEGALLTSRLPTNLQNNTATDKNLVTMEATDDSLVFYSYPVAAAADMLVTESEITTPPTEAAIEGEESPIQSAAGVTAGVSDDRLAYVGFALVLLLATITLYVTPKRNEMV